jgi:hypothetical protein
MDESHERRGTRIFANYSRTPQGLSAPRGVLAGCAALKFAGSFLFLLVQMSVPLPWAEAAGRAGLFPVLIQSDGWAAFSQAAHNNTLQENTLPQ